MKQLTWTGKQYAINKETVDMAARATSIQVEGSEHF